MRRQDFRDGIRSLRRSPGFSLVAILTLAVGIGSVTALFTAVDGILLRPLRYPGADRLVSVVNQYQDWSRTDNLAGGDEIDVAAEPGIFEAFAYYHGGEMGVQVAGHAEFVGARLVHPEFFQVFGVPPLAGRVLASGSDQSANSAVVGLGFAVRNFGSAVAALGQSLFIERRSYEIVGVMPAAMQFPANTDVWAAAPLLPENRNRTGHNYRSVARLAPGVSVEGASDRLAVLAARLAVAFPASNERKTFRAIPHRDTLVSQVQTTLYVLLGAVILVLVIACANVANLMLARGSGRSKEMAVRIALGAGRRHVVGQLLAESVILASIACALGVLLAYAGTTLLVRVGASFVPLPRLNEIGVDWRVLGFSMALSLATAVAFGLAPALQASRTEVSDALSRAGLRGALGGGAGASRLRASLVVAEIAVSCMLVINAGLLVRSFLALTDVPLGFRTSGMLVMYAHAPARGSIFDRSGVEDYVRIGRFFDELFVKLHRLPEVTAVGGTMGMPTGQYNASGAYAVEGKQTFDGDFRRLPSAGYRLASPRYFETMNIPILHGRDFDDGDVYDRPPVAIVSQLLATQTFGADDPLGHRIMCGLDRPDLWMTIVGVVGDVRQASPASEPGPQLYMPLRQHPYAANEVQVVIRTRVPPESLTSAVQQVVRAANPDVATKFTTLEQSVGSSMAAPRFRALLVSVFAGMALLLALGGIYAVMSYTTAQRMAEFGLRMALGAESRDVVRLVLVRAGRLAVLGAAIGLPMAVASGRIISSLLYGVSATDLMTYGAVVVTALPLVVAASAIPARRASRVDPVLALAAS
jgi:predicted permease